MTTGCTTHKADEYERNLAQMDERIRSADVSAGRVPWRAVAGIDEVLHLIATPDRAADQEKQAELSRAAPR